MKKSILKSPLRYPGGKSRAIKYLKNYIPEGTRELISPFLGGGSFELYCASALDITVHAADVFCPVAVFWGCLIANPVMLADTVASYGLPITRDAFYALRSKFSSITDPFHLASAYFILNRCSFSGTISGGFTSYHMDKTGRNPRFNESTIENLKTFRIPDGKFRITKDSFEVTLQKYPADIFSYLDPPYLIDSKIYGKKGDNSHNIDHELLANILRSRRGPWLLSYNNCEEVKELYYGYYILEDIQWTYGMNKDKKSKELLILSKELELSLDIKNSSCK
jgi:DNA adenine methylase